MKLTILLLSLVLAFTVVESIQYGLLQQTIIIPSNGNKSVQYQITYPLHEEFDENNVVDIRYHDMSTDKVILYLYSMDPVVFILESEPGYGIFGMYTIKYVRGDGGLESPALPSTKHQVEFPSSDSETPILVNLSKNDGDIITVIRLYEYQINDYYTYTILEGGVGFNYVTLKVHSVSVEGRNVIDILLA